MSITEFAQQPLTSPTPVWSSYIDRDLEFKPYVQFPVGSNEVMPGNQFVVDENLQRIVDAACGWVQDYLSRPIAPTEFFRRFDGWTNWQGSYLVLPYYPVLRIINITEWWGLSGPHVLTEQTPQSQFGQTGVGQQADVYQLEPVSGIVRRTFPGLVQKPFFPGSRNIEVTWIAGYDPIPAQVKLATLELAAYWYRNTQEATRMAAPRIGYGEEETRNELWPAIPSRITALLQPYEQQNMG